MVVDYIISREVTAPADDPFVCHSSSRLSTGARPDLKGKAGDGTRLHHCGKKQTSSTSVSTEDQNFRSCLCGGFTTEGKEGRTGGSREGGRFASMKERVQVCSVRSWPERRYLVRLTE